MPSPRKVFRIEESGHAPVDDAILTPAAPAPDDEMALRHHELMTEIIALRALLAPRPQMVRPQVQHEPVENGHDEIEQAQALKSELKIIHDAVRRTKQELDAPPASVIFGPNTARVGKELDAVVAGTELATQNILKAAEDIDQLASTMSSLLKGEYAQGLAQDMRDQVVRIFEACNFQDLTGQRISKVLSTLNFIEDHITRMQGIWSILERMEPSASPVAQEKSSPDSKLLNGPKLAGDAGHSTQADIDRLFDNN
jgi:chemotaxis protein CheZ